MLVFTFESQLTSSDGSHVSDSQSFPVPEQPQFVVAVLQGFDIEFSNRHDHHLGRVDVNVNADVDGALTDTVNVRVDLGLRDWSDGSSGDDDNGNDPFNGSVRYSVLVG